MDNDLKEKLAVLAKEVEERKNILKDLQATELVSI